ncbi:MAG: GntR family transcriptional regulator [Neisseria sp.]|uniref:GntR family transcriptional regulator n=1 Tax=Neisseria sp. TaxID=192066 RepID=UPI0026DD3A0E|nr:GntR family transcriptional regulator [Neisseria sp.]MDO4640895.1 GntR family transcriptional regulator [Neisseria sp.]
MSEIQTIVDDSAASDTRHDSELSRVYYEILKAITDRVLLPGRKLTESDLCRQMVCSRNTVRGALSLLAHDKIVDLQPNRGAFVHVPDLQEIRDVFSMRIALEEMALTRLTELPDLAEKLLPVFSLVIQEDEALATGDKVGRARLSNAFHIELVKVLGNQVLVDIMASLCARSSLMAALTRRSVPYEDSKNEHRDLLELLLAGRGKRAGKKMRKHLQAALAGLEAQFDHWE